MSIKQKSVLWIIVAIAGLSAAFFALSAAQSKTSVHDISPGEAFNDNPLKGFLPFSNSYTEFPHSMEWFYIPMSAFYPDPASTPDTKPDFSALEKELKRIADRGNQAVFRVYLDYPATDPEDKPIGIPKFLLNTPYNLITHDYSQFGNFISQMPDYSDRNLRKTIRNCIAAMGEKYDGDARIGFITAGFLGFWGEWHCGKYNGTDYPLNYEPTTEVYNEVTDAFKCFTKTRILFRYPTKGKSPGIPQFGYHDDSYCYETAPVSSGGEVYYFGEMLKAAGTSNRWETAPIGGELRPEIQKTIFASEPWTGAPDRPNESWDTDLKLIHPSWLINEGIKTYKGEEKTAAEKAANQMGYELRVEKAYYKDDLKKSDRLFLAVDIRNIGAAPFYYDHALWPVKVGIKRDGKLIDSWTTDWDLDAIAADGKAVRFEWSGSGRNGLKAGYYNLCIKVENPLPNGNALGFANEYQYDDGWLDLGLFTAAKGGGMPKPAPAARPVHQPKPTPKAEAAKSAADKNTYEAESPDNTLGGAAAVSGGDTYSGGLKVGYVGNADGTLQFNKVQASKDGDCILTIFYATAEERSMMISINGETGVKIDLEPGISWTKVLTKEVPVKLKAGDNIIRMYNDEGWAPDIDKISIK
jgi:hypothetical protein